MSLAEVENDQAAAGADPWQTLRRDDLKLHDGLMRRAVQFGGLEEPYIVSLALPAHERIDVPGRWRRAPGCVVRWDDYIETLPQVQQGLAALQPLGGIEERAVPDAESLLGLLSGEDRPARGEQAVDIA